MVNTRGIGSSKPISNDTRLRFRVYVEGELIEETWIDVLDPKTHAGLADELRDRHHAITEQADTDDKAWLIEMYDPAQPEETAYHRVGTDTAGMVDPLLPNDAT